MHRSGLALAGAQSTLEAWKRGETPPTTNDGIVTADEVGLLKLDGTWLVVLSACDTGMGEIKAGEGVLGLRRGFIQAGAENLLIEDIGIALADQLSARLLQLLSGGEFGCQLFSKFFLCLLSLLSLGDVESDAATRDALAIRTTGNGKLTDDGVMDESVAMRQRFDRLDT